MLVLLLIIFRKRKRVRKIKLNARFFIHSSNIFIRSKDVYFAVEKPPIQLEKQTQKKERKKIFFHSFPKKGGVGCRLCARLVFFLDETQKTNPQAGDGGAKRRSSRSSSSKKKKKQLRVPSKKNSTTRAWKSKFYAPFARTLLTFAFLAFFLPFSSERSGDGSKVYERFFSIFFFLLFFFLLAGCSSPPPPRPKKKFFEHLTPPLLSFSSVAWLLFFCLVFAIKKNTYDIAAYKEQEERARWKSRASSKLSTRVSSLFLFSFSPAAGCACFFLWRDNKKEREREREREREYFVRTKQKGKKMWFFVDPIL